jgi:ribulose-5-phosphate 4-epimerase/fuculose-1-phosphate aldolase
MPMSAMAAIALAPEEIPSVRDKVTPEEWQVRVDLAACYRLIRPLRHVGHDWHAYLPARGEDNAFLINPYGLFFEEITASSLVKIDLDGNVLSDSEYPVNAAGYTIHSAVHAVRHDVNCALHTHTRAGMAISALKCGLLPMSQHAARFIDNIGYHD